jgi:hypothetical protein
MVELIGDRAELAADPWRDLPVANYFTRKEPAARATAPLRRPGRHVRNRQTRT